jgi:Macrocin-O-methyltransferase (TylF)
MTIWQRIKARLGLYERRFIHDPLRKVPELREIITDELQQRNGSDARNCQAVADALVFAVQYVIGASVEGDIAEFGCMTGRTATVLSGAMASFRTEKLLHLFDSFEGLPETTNEIDAASFHTREGTWRPGTCKGISPEALRKRCLEFLKPEQVRIYEGWFSKTISQFPDGTRLGLLHVDCDLYESAKDVLDYVFSKQMVAEGAIVLFDDWNCNRASKNLGERKVWAEMVSKYQIEFSDHGSYGWASHKFIVHNYTKR